MNPGNGEGGSHWRGVVLAALACALGVAAPAAASDDPLTFQPFAAYGVGSDPESVAIADVTGDGRNDVLISTSSYFDPENDGKLFVFAQTPDGNLANTARLATDGPSLGMGLSAGDLNGDGLADAALATASGVDLYFQESGHLVGPTLVPGTSSAMYVEVGDVNLDGRKDLVIGLNGGGILYARNTGVGFDVITRSAT